MTFVRRNVWDLGGDWAEPVLWYARGVAELSRRPLADPVSWRFYGAIHGFDKDLWEYFGYLDASDKQPSRGLVDKFWNQCQHTSWYFLPWHRGYLLAFEKTVRAAIVELGGPADWALPYWNYFKTGQNKLPPAFAENKWPDKGDNPLFVRQRYGPDGNGKKIRVRLTKVDLKAMGEREFTGVSTGGSPGFGGVDTGFLHDGGTTGRIELQPHNWVHGEVGGEHNGDFDQPGVLAVPDSAGLDPVFWLHHANIDRLWESWNRPPRSHTNPTDRRWLDGPSERPFVLPLPDRTTWTFTPGEVADIQALGYEYDSLAPAVVPVSATERLERLGILDRIKGAQAVPGDTNVELVGATTESVPVRGGDVRAQLRLDSDMRRKVSASLSAEPGPEFRAAAEGGATAPDRLFLNLENVRGKSDAATFDVYVGVPDDEEPTEHPDRLAGSIAPFGLRRASDPDREHGGQGLTFVLEITDIVDQLHLDSSFDVDNLPVRIVPTRPVADAAELRIGRISIFRSGRELPENNFRV